MSKLVIVKCLVYLDTTLSMKHLFESFKIISMSLKYLSDSSSTIENPLVDQSDELWSPKGWENYFSGNIVKHLNYIKNNSNSTYETSLVRYKTQNDQVSNIKNGQSCLNNTNIQLTVKTIGTKSNNSTLEQEELIRSGLKQLVIYATKLKDLCRELVPSNLQWNNILYGDMILFLKNQMNSDAALTSGDARIRVFGVQNRPGDGFNPITVLKTKNRKEVLYGEL